MLPAVFEAQIPLTYYIFNINLIIGINPVAGRTLPSTATLVRKQ
ncbi:MAG: hypothetical protein ACJA1J_003340 [Sulfitobacter pontiacus]|jgi:hypothetical protein